MTCFPGAGSQFSPERLILASVVFASNNPDVWSMTMPLSSRKIEVHCISVVPFWIEQIARGVVESTTGSFTVQLPILDGASRTRAQ